MRAKVFCMASAKGGSGKTLLTTTFGTFLASLGYKILLVDTDAATNGLTLLHLKEVRIQADHAISAQRQPRGVYEAVTPDQPCEIVTLDTGVDLVPALYSFSDTEDVALDVYESSLVSILALARTKYDYIFIDAQAGSDSYAQVAMRRTVSDQVIIVSEYDPMSAAGVERLKAILRQDLTYDRTWYLLNKMLPDFVQSFSDFLEVAKYLSPIPWDAEVVKAYARRKIALDTEEGNEHTLAIIQTVRGLLRDEIEKELAGWMESRAAKIRQPLALQYHDTELELKSLLVEAAESSVRERRRYMQRSLGSILLVLPLSWFGNEIAAFFLLVSPSSSKWFAPLSMFIMLIFFGLLVLVYARAGSNPEQSYEQLRSRRRVALLEERLTKLEALREASLEKLIKDRKI